VRESLKQQRGGGGTGKSGTFRKHKKKGKMVNIEAAEEKTGKGQGNRKTRKKIFNEEPSESGRIKGGRSPGGYRKVRESEDDIQVAKGNT